MATRPIIAWIGGGYLDQQFEDTGYDVRRIRFFTPRVLDWTLICEEIDGEPDIVFYADASLPPPLAGVETFPCLTVFYCVDSHIHEWYPLYAQAFDLCAVSLKKHIPRMLLRLDRKSVFWLPPFPIRGERPPATPPDRIWDVLFVGHVDAETTPIRKHFLKQFSKYMPNTTILEGEFSKLFPQAKIVLNIAEKGDLNFRVFEALATGACLLTPQIGNGQDELFKEGVHLFTYEHNNPVDAAEKALELLARPDVCERARLEGSVLIDSNHRRRHRVELILKKIRATDKDKIIRERLAQSEQIRETYLRLVYLQWASIVRDPTAQRLYLESGRRSPLHKTHGAASVNNTPC